MAKKHLPIQFFEKRKDYDDRSTEGGGNSAPPSWVLTGDALTAKSSALTSSVGDVITVFRERQSQEKKLPLVVCTTLEEKAIAKSHRSEITGLYIDENGSNTISGHPGSFFTFFRYLNPCEKRYFLTISSGFEFVLRIWDIFMLRTSLE